jgi:hypothetical protein
MLAGVLNPSSGRYLVPIAPTQYKETKWPDQCDILISKHRFVSEEVSEGAVVERTPENDALRVRGPVAVVLANAQVIMEQLRRQGGLAINRIFDLLEMVTRMCPPDYEMKLFVEDEAVAQKWEEMKAASNNGFTGASPCLLNGDPIPGFH